jgi:hypothetical protein
MKLVLAFLAILSLLCFARPVGATGTYPSCGGCMDLNQFATESCSAMPGILKAQIPSKYDPQLTLKQKAQVNRGWQIYYSKCGTQVIFPKFYVLSLVYAPPGCTGCAHGGDVEYEGDSSAGTKHSTDHSFKAASQLDATLGSDAAFFSASASAGFTRTATTSHSVTISKEQNFKIDVSSSQDGVSHNRDLFFIFMNPAVVVRSDGAWNMGTKGPTAHVAQIAVAALKTCSFSSTSAFRNFTSSDCQTVLSLDPFVSDPAADPDNIPHRFVPTTWEPGYEPNGQGPDGCGILSGTMKNEFENMDSQTVEKEYTVGYSLKVGSSASPATLKASQDFTWTDSSSVENTTSSSQSATWTLPCPAADPGYAYIQVYWDSLYGTFMFMPRLASAGLIVYQGHVPNSNGKLILAELTYGGRTYHTTTDRNGNYRFFVSRKLSSRALPPTARLSVRGVKQAVQLLRKPVQMR